MKLFLKARTKNANSIRLFFFFFFAAIITMDAAVTQVNYSVGPRQQGCCVITIVVRGVAVWVTQP